MSNHDTANDHHDHTAFPTKSTTVQRPVVAFNNKILQMLEPKAYPEDDEPLCAPKLRQGGKGHQESDCKKNHLCQTKWSKPRVSFIKGWMADDNRTNMKWNHAVVLPSVLNMEDSKEMTAR